MKVFVVYMHDRHYDPQISVHETRHGADAAIEKFKASYADDGYEWSERNYGQPKWVRYVDTGGGDGPNARIETTEVLE